MKNFWTNLKKPIRVLAPMEDITDTVFRQLIAKWAPADVYFTEFTNAEGIGSMGKNKVLHRWRYTENERPIVAQIWGLSPKMHYKSARMAKKLGFNGIDINMGCPVKKIIKKGACSALIDNPTLAKEIIETTKKGAMGLPVSVKTRIGFKKIKTEEWFTFLLQQNIQAVTVHGRIAKSMSSKEANWSEIEKVVRLKNKISPNTIIIGNGDIKKYTEINQKHLTYGVDGVMVARGILENILLFKKGMDMQNVRIDKKLKMLEEHMKLFEKTWGNNKKYSNFKKYYKIYIKGFRKAGFIRTELMKTKTFEEALSYIANFNMYL